MKRAVVLLAAGVIVVAGWMPFRHSAGVIHVTAWFPRTVSLYPGSDVRVLGLPAGRVSSVRADGNAVRVDLTVRNDVPVPAEVRATILPASLIGERYVQLFPGWTAGPKLADNSTIPLARTTIPVEIDEALQSIGTLVEALDPAATKRLVHGLAGDLAGQGAAINDALAHIGRVAQTLGDKSEDIGAIVEGFDKFTRALASREGQLGHVLDDFATLTDVLAKQREHVEGIVRNLSSFAGDARDVLAESSATLGTDLKTLGRVARALQANIGSLSQLMDAAPLYGTGMKAAYDPVYRRIDLRLVVTPTVAQATHALGDLLGVPLPDTCIPLDVACQTLLSLEGLR